MDVSKIAPENEILKHAGSRLGVRCRAKPVRALNAPRSTKEVELVRKRGSQTATRSDQNARWNRADTQQVELLLAESAEPATDSSRLCFQWL